MNMSHIASYAFSLKILTGIILIGCVALISCAIVRMRGKNKKDLIGFSIGCTLVCALFCLMICPIEIEEYTETVTITRLGDGIWDSHHVYFNADGEEYYLRWEESQRDMFEMLVGKEVNLSYGRIYSIVEKILPIASRYRDGEWWYGDIALPD
jgi:hypothetical protein